MDEVSSRRCSDEFRGADLCLGGCFTKEDACLLACLSGGCGLTFEATCLSDATGRRKRRARAAAVLLPYGLVASL